LRIRLRTLLAGPQGIIAPGSEVDWPDAEARELIRAGYAEAVGLPESIPPLLETATAEPPEAAVTRRGRSARSGP